MREMAQLYQTEQSNSFTGLPASEGKPYVFVCVGAALILPLDKRRCNINGCNPL
ncbi:hypothetical protein [Microseira sp. BLCC-F43]|jgi:hypothetical protein|uniref:hypothetical protein n=1 Tax=Microseira sp. BLCC-F43 TaxID=3153602 RepID=UPI0035B71268